MQPSRDVFLVRGYELLSLQTHSDVVFTNYLVVRLTVVSPHQNMLCLNAAFHMLTIRNVNY